MGFHYKKNIGKGYQMKHGNSAFKMVTPTIADNAGLFYKLKEGIPNTLDRVGLVLGGLGLGQLIRSGAKKVSEVGIRKAVPFIGREILKKGGQKGGDAAIETVTNIMNPFAK